MIRKFICLFLLICSTGVVFAQVNLSGKVINAETRQPLAAASVYLSNTSIGSATNEHGIFKLVGIPSGKYKLIVSYVGYETFVMALSYNHLPNELVIELKPETQELAGVVLEPYETNGWDKWGQFFIDNFIGTSSFARDCELENQHSLKFRFSKKENILYAYAKEPLLIKNNALGYEIRYTLEEFQYDFTQKLLMYNGYPLFKDMSAEYPKKSRRWKEKRAAVYNGSLMHFMRAFFVNKCVEEGFEIRSLARIPNLLKARAKELFKHNKDTIIEKTLDTLFKKNATGFTRTVRTLDSTIVYKKALLQTDSLISRQLVICDSIGFAIDSSTAGLYSVDSLEITCLFKDVPIEYKRLFPIHKYDKAPVSQLTFIGQRPIAILSNGCYFGPHDLKITGFWSWWETVGTMLPYDYQPPKN